VRAIVRPRVSITIAAAVAAVIIYAAPGGFHDRAILGKATPPVAAHVAILGKA
jgi:hypothetical protein